MHTNDDCPWLHFDQLWPWSSAHVRNITCSNIWLNQQILRIRKSGQLDNFEHNKQRTTGTTFWACDERQEKRLK